MEEFDIIKDTANTHLPKPGDALIDPMADIQEDSIPEGEEQDSYDLVQITSKGKTLTKLDIWERKLLDFSLRNALLNLSTRRRAIEFISFDIKHITDSLLGGAEFRITATPDEETSISAPRRLRESRLQEHLQQQIKEDTAHRLLHTFLPEDETRSVLKNIYRVGRNAIEESGANSLFLAIGALRWYVSDKSTTPRYAPLLLLPVEMVYKKGSYHIRTRDEEITFNITLLEFLRQNFDIDIKDLEQLPMDSSGLDVARIFSIFREGVKENDRWDVEEECLLGIFSFSKFLMWNDVHNHRDALAANDLIASLVSNRLTWNPETTSIGLHAFDRNVAPIETAIPVAVDSSQMAAVIKGGSGHSFIIYGPPGTGKSQTITNLIANALYHGKRVLFVAEKMAALSVVQRRLEKIGLDPFCLELHSNKSTKRHVLKQLEKALKAVHIKSQSDFASEADRVFEKRKELLRYIDALHTPDKRDGLSPFDCILKAESIDAEAMEGFRYEKKIDLLLSQDGTREIDEILRRRLPTVIRLTGQPSKHPLKGLKVDRTMLMDTEKIAMGMKSDANLLSQYSKETTKLAEAKGIRERLLRDNAPTIFEEDPEELRQEWRKAKGKWWIPRYFAKRTYLKKLRHYNPLLSEEEIEPLLENLREYRTRHTRIEELNKIVNERFGKEYSDDEVPSEEYLDEVATMLARWSEHSSEMRGWLHFNELCDDLREKGMGCVADSMTTREVNPSDVRDTFMKALFLHKANEKIAMSETLATFEGLLFDEKTAAYRHLVEEFQHLTRRELYARLASRVPRLTEYDKIGGEVALIHRNISNGGRGISLRELFDEAPTLLSLLCPVMLMSPMSVAQYINLNADKFDLVIFDEASQMPTSEAVGAIARGKSLIVVGDPKQMPPTTFFTSTNVDVEEASIDDMESILEDCRTLSMPALQLSWHYRSRHESLIAFSNNEYYEGSLITFPSVDDNDTKVHFVHVEGGLYEKGGRRCNEAEAEAIVEEIARRLRNHKLRRHSIGVIAFSVMQQGLIEDLLQDRLEHDKKLQEAAAEMHEPIFVKNLENVQGDERDVILFSIGYGPDKDGKISMNFGPLNNSGGERRLNVAVSRARQEMYVFSTLRASDIDLRRTNAKGVEGLKHFLYYAETNTLPSTSAKTMNAEENDAIARHIAEELEKLGYKTAVGVGRSQFKVDVAVESKEEPGKFDLAILLDGHTYRDTATTRDREVVQPSVLENLHWKVMRVWSVDWMRNRHHVIERILERLEEKNPTERPMSSIQAFDISKEKEMEVVTNAREYKAYSPHHLEIPHISYQDLVRNIIECEQPITFPLLCRRFISIRGNLRNTQALQRDLKYYSSQYYTDESESIWISEEASHGYEYYRVNSGRDIAETPSIEILNAIIETLKEQVALDEDSLVVLAPRKLGFTRKSANIDSAVRQALESLKESGRVEAIGERIRLRVAGSE